MAVSDEVLQGLLDRASTDPAFAQRLARSPLTVLEEQGVLTQDELEAFLGDAIPYPVADLPQLRQSLHTAMVARYLEYFKNKYPGESPRCVQAELKAFRGESPRC